MSFGIRSWDASGALLWDSTAAGSGVVVDVRVVPAFQAATFLYPDFAGHTFATLVLFAFGDTGVTVDTALGYPRVNAPVYSDPRKILMLAF